MSKDYYDQSRVNNHNRPRPQGVKHGGLTKVIHFPLTPRGGVAPVPPAGRRRGPGEGK